MAIKLHVNNKMTTIYKQALIFCLHNNAILSFYYVTNHPMTANLQPIISKMVGAVNTCYTASRVLNDPRLPVTLQAKCYFNKLRRQVFVSTVLNGVDLIRLFRRPNPPPSFLRYRLPPPPPPPPRILLQQQVATNSIWRW